MTLIPAQLLSALSGEPEPLLAGHVTPDADSLGSMLALALGLEGQGRGPILCALPSGTVSKRLQFLVEWARPRIATPQQCRQHRLVVCDTAKAQRVNLPEPMGEELASECVIANIDHHASNTKFAQINWVDPQASSTAEMIYRLYKEAGWPFTPTTASLLYAGIHGDTVGFSLTNTTATALFAAAELVDCGAEVGRIGEHICRSQSESEFNLRRLIYDNTRLSSTGRIAFSTASFQEIKRAGCSAADIDDQVEIPRALDGAALALLFTEGSLSRVRINIRSKHAISVLALAQQFHGGGHHAAAGAVYKGTIEDALSNVIPAAELYLDKMQAEAGEDP